MIILLVHLSDCCKPEKEGRARALVDQVMKIRQTRILNGRVNLAGIRASGCRPHFSNPRYHTLQALRSTKTSMAMAKAASSCQEHYPGYADSTCLEPRHNISYGFSASMVGSEQAFWLHSGCFFRPRMWTTSPNLLTGRKSSLD